jgi:hypothetical protein
MIEKSFDLMIEKSFDLLFRSHEIRPPDPDPLKVIPSKIVLILKEYYSNEKNLYF